jgi:hypothetical protein
VNHLTTDTISDEQIETLATEAGQAGDEQMLHTCGRALQGSRNDRLECAKAINSARAMVESSESFEHLEDR